MEEELMDKNYTEKHFPDCGCGCSGPIALDASDVWISKGSQVAFYVFCDAEAKDNELCDSCENTARVRVEIEKDGEVTRTIGLCAPCAVDLAAQTVPVWSSPVALLATLGCEGA